MRHGNWPKPIGCERNKFAKDSRQQRRRRGFAARVVALNEEFGFNMPRTVRRSIAWASWRTEAVNG